MRQFLVHVAGRDEPGITASITRHFGSLNAQIIDIEQTVVFGQLSLHFHVRAPLEAAVELERGLRKQLTSFSLSISVEAVEGDIPMADPANRFVVTIIANDVHPNFIADVTSGLADFQANIDSIRKLNNGSLETIEFVCSATTEVKIKEISRHLLSIASKYSDVDLAVQRENLYRRSKRLIAFDMDSTLIQGEVIDDLAARVGHAEAVAAITKDAMEGRIDFPTSLRQRVQLLKGVSHEDLEAVADELKLTPGAATLIAVLKKLGYKIAVISGGFTYFVEHLKRELGLHYAYANRLEFESGQATGRIEGPIVDAQRKADILEVIAQQEDIPMDQIIAIGDGANDILMLQKAGLGIAFNAKPATRAGAHTALTKKSMTSILYLLGITDNEIHAMGYQISALNSQKRAKKQQA